SVKIGMLPEKKQSMNCGDCPLLLCTLARKLIQSGVKRHFYEQMSQVASTGVPVGKRASQAGGKGFQVVEANLPHSRQNYRRSGSEQFVHCCQVPFVPELLSLWDLKGDRGLAGCARSVP